MLDIEKTTTSEYNKTTKIPLTLIECSSSVTIGNIQNSTKGITEEKDDWISNVNERDSSKDKSGITYGFQVNMFYVALNGLNNMSAGLYKTYRLY